VGGGTAGSSWAGRVSGRMIIPAVSPVRRGSRAAICHGAQVALFGTCGVRVVVFRLAMVQGTD